MSYVEWEEMTLAELIYLYFHDFFNLFFFICFTLCLTLGLPGDTGVAELQYTNLNLARTF